MTPQPPLLLLLLLPVLLPDVVAPPPPTSCVVGGFTALLNCTRAASQAGGRTVRALAVPGVVEMPSSHWSPVRTPPPHHPHPTPLGPRASVPHSPRATAAHKSPESTHNHPSTTAD